jgi:hypothetical protein
MRTPLYASSICSEFADLEYNGVQSGYALESEFGHDDGVAQPFEPIHPTNNLEEYHLGGDMNSADTQREEREGDESCGMGSTHSKDKLVYPGPLIPLPLPVPVSSTQTTAPAEEASSPWKIDAMSPVKYDLSNVGSLFYDDQDLYPHELSISSVSSTSCADWDSKEFVMCDESDCQAKFTGHHKEANILRHKRLKHGNVNSDSKYPCPVAHCGKAYARQDARLKHLRTAHAQYAPDCLPPLQSRHGR